MHGKTSKRAQIALRQPPATTDDSHHDEHSRHENISLDPPFAVLQNPKTIAVVTSSQLQSRNITLSSRHLRTIYIVASSLSPHFPCCRITLLSCCRMIVIVAPSQSSHHHCHRTIAVFAPRPSSHHRTGAIVALSHHRFRRTITPSHHRHRRAVASSPSSRHRCRRAINIVTLSLLS